MSASETEFAKRMVELSLRAATRYEYIYSEFLSQGEQEVLARLSWPAAAAPYCLFGGYPEAERKLVCFGGGQPGEQPPDWPLCCILVQSKSGQFQQQLSHRDVLGSVMAQGIRRSVVGDILLQGQEAYLFCLADLAPYLCEQLHQIHHRSVQCSIVPAPPQEALPTLQEQELVVASLRLDALVAAVYKLSRGDSQQLILSGRVFVQDKAITNPSHSPQQGARISVRGQGRFYYLLTDGETRKGRLRVRVKM